MLTRTTNNYGVRNGVSSTAISNGLLLVKESPDLFEDLSFAENIFFFTYSKKRLLSFSGNTMAKKCSDLLLEMGLDILPKTLVRDLKPSDRMIIALLQALQQKPNLIFLMRHYRSSALGI